MDKRRAQAFALIATLAEAYPDTFFVFHGRRPLKIGIRDDILAAHPEIDSRTLSDAVRTYTAHFSYQKACKAGVERIDLNGVPVGCVTTEQAEHALEKVKKLGTKKPRIAPAQAPVKVEPAPRRIGLGDLKAAAAARKATAARARTTRSSAGSYDVISCRGVAQH